jgi:hypothetical protein
MEQLDFGIQYKYLTINILTYWHIYSIGVYIIENKI